MQITQLNELIYIYQKILRKQMEQIQVYLLELDCLLDQQLQLQLVLVY